MSGFFGAAKAQLKTAQAGAPFNPNSCGTCLSNLLESISTGAWDCLKPCRHVVKTARALQDTSLFVELGVCSAKEAQALCKCVACYSGGRDCFQLPESVVPDVVAFMKILLSDFGPPKAPIPTVDLSYREDLDEIQDSARSLLRKVGLAIGSSYVQNERTPLHSGEPAFVDTKVLGLTESQKKRARAVLAADEDEEVPTTPRKRVRGGRGVLSRDSESAGLVQKEMDLLAHWLVKALPVKQREAFKRAYDDLQPSDYSAF